MIYLLTPNSTKKRANPHIPFSENTLKNPFKELYRFSRDLSNLTPVRKRGNRGAGKRFPSVLNEKIKSTTCDFSQKRVSLLKDLFKSGGHVGHRPLKLPLSRFWYPPTSRYLIGDRNKMGIINPIVTTEQTAKGLYMAASILSKKGHILVIDTRGEISPLTSLLENNSNKIPSLLSFSGDRWLGGTLTNWDSISKMIRRCAQISKKFDKFLTENRIHLPRYEKMRQAYPGFLKIQRREINLRLKGRPDLLLIINPNENRHIVEEAKRLSIPVVGFVDSNTDSTHLTVAIPINGNCAIWSNNFITTLINLTTCLSPHPNLYPSKEG